MTPELILKAGPRALTPDVPEEVRRDLGKLETFRKAAEDCARLRYAEMHRRQTAIAQANQQIEHKACNGLGEKVATIDTEVYFQMRALYGDECWSDPEFVKAFLRDNPACRVKTTRGTRGQEYAGRGR